ncbi:MAG: NAD-dependent succinate-semialdehyde dehydrogenase [Candidatus Micrarchaeota archaeon]|nr:NAD-dependent succinate-semialdehyde dehydrogenase [Candidatus Micrarchaeota archaeon]
MKIRSINPATGELNREFEALDKKGAITALKQTREAFGHWKSLGIKERCAHLKKLSMVLLKNKESYARLITIEMGKPIRQAIAEIEKSAATAELYSERSEEWLKEEEVSADGKRHLVTFEPIGTVLCVMPWNFPFWQALRFAIPSLALGNTIVLRHSNAVPMCAIAIEEAFKEAGFPEGVFKTVITDHKTVEAMIKSKFVDGVSVTGGLGVGSMVGKIAGKSVKKSVLELGGNDPFIVLEDADIESAAKNAVIGRMQNNGQSCIAAKRFIVVKEVADKFTKRFVEEVEMLKVGNPISTDVDIGPLANRQQVDTLDEQVRDAIAKGAKVLVGGKRIEGNGAFYQPTIVTNTKKNMKMVREEVFGPAAPIIVVKNEKEAIKVANDSDLGLGASVWTSSEQRGLEVGRQLEAGMVFVNAIVKSDARLPFGGIKKSGVGRELSKYGLKEFANVKTINIYAGSGHTSINVSE